MLTRRHRAVRMQWGNADAGVGGCTGWGMAGSLSTMSTTFAGLFHFACKHVSKQLEDTRVNDVIDVYHAHCLTVVLLKTHLVRDKASSQWRFQQTLGFLLTLTFFSASFWCTLGINANFRLLWIKCHIPNLLNVVFICIKRYPTYLYI